MGEVTGDGSPVPDLDRGELLFHLDEGRVLLFDHRRLFERPVRAGRADLEAVFCIIRQVIRLFEPFDVDDVLRRYVSP